MVVACTLSERIGWFHPQTEQSLCQESTSFSSLCFGLQRAMETKQRAMLRITHQAGFDESYEVITKTRLTKLNEKKYRD
jgi:hypothetical protein